jgi:hypothetical protein
MSIHNLCIFFERTKFDYTINCFSYLRISTCLYYKQIEIIRSPQAQTPGGLYRYGSPTTRKCQGNSSVVKMFVRYHQHVLPVNNTWSENKFRELATVCLPWQHWTKALVWFDDVNTLGTGDADLRHLRFCVINV